MTYFLLRMYSLLCPSHWPSAVLVPYTCYDAYILLNTNRSMSSWQTCMLHNYSIEPHSFLLPNSSHCGNKTSHVHCRNTSPKIISSVSVTPSQRSSRETCWLQDIRLYSNASLAWSTTRRRYSTMKRSYVHAAMIIIIQRRAFSVLLRLMN